MNGLILAPNIRRIDYYVKIFMITAYDIHHIRAPEFESARLDEVLQKPLRLSILKAIIDKLLITDLT
jgi:hypothetical protein